jgi:hypothetical protein
MYTLPAVLFRLAGPVVRIAAWLRHGRRERLALSHAA